jgi:murein L,D-transpeptidase YafK
MFLFSRFLLVVLTLALLLPLSAAASLNKADRVVVVKKERRLYLYRGEQVLRSYRVSLGANPVGHKRRQGDKRTPEGRYLLDWRNPESRFYRSIHISYPNSRDLQQARNKGISPGGAIMIHGLPNKYAEAPELFSDWDWTEGCIAVNNRAMDEIWRLVADNTPIEIHP